MVLLALLLLAIPRGFIASSWLHLPLGVEHSLPSSSARESSSFTNEFESKLDCNFRSGEYQYHGTTTLSFQFGDSVIVCVDSRASIGDYVGSRTVKKVFPVSDTAVATMAGGAADCAFWIRQISLRSKIFSYNYGDSLSVSSFAKLLSTTLRDYKGKGYIIAYRFVININISNLIGLSVGTMIAGLDGSGEPSSNFNYNALCKR